MQPIILNLYQSVTVKYSLLHTFWAMICNRSVAYLYDKSVMPLPKVLLSDFITDLIQKQIFAIYNRTYCVISQLSTYHCSIIIIPKIIAHSSPHSIMTYFYSAFIFNITIYETYVCIIAWNQTCNTSILIVTAIVICRV